MDVAKRRPRPRPRHAEVPTKDEKATPTIREVERALLGAGLSAREAKAVLSGGYDALLTADEIAERETADALRRLLNVMQP